MPTNYNRANLITESATLFPDNNSQLISPADLRQWLEDATTSFVTQKDKSTLENAIFENKASTLASGATVDLNTATGNYLHISGAATINSFGTCPAGARFIIVFDAAATLTYNATSLIIPGLANKTAAAGDCCMIVSEGLGNWRIVGYFAISGGGGGGSVTAVTGTAPIASSGGTAPDISIPQANGSTDGFLDSADWTTFNGKQDTLSAGTGISIISNVITNTAPSSGGTVTTTGTPSSGQITKFSGATSITNATAGVGGDYVAPGAATASGLTMATSRLLGRTTASPGAIEEITVGSGLSLSAGSLSATGSGSGTVNSGTANRLTYYAATGTAVSELPTAGSSGQLLQSNGTGSAPSWVAAPAATMTIGSSVVSGATAGRLLLTTTSGANQVLNQDSLLNYDTTNDRLGIGIASPTATLHLAAGVAANPQMLLVPSAITPTGTTNGSIWCNTVSSNTTLTMYKDSALTKVITLDRNPDLATSGSGIVQADANGTLSKGADLTALGIFAQTSTVTVANTGTSTTLIGTVTGVTTLPANFFGVGKTIKIFVSGTYNQATGSQDCALKLTIGGVAVGTITFAHNGGLTTVYYDAEFTLTCRTAGASGTLQFMGIGRLNHTGSSLLNFFQVSSTSGSINTTGTLAIDLQADWVTADPDNSITASILTATYLN
jgi:hypothetical protein